MNACVYLKKFITKEYNENTYYSTIHPLHLIALYGSINSHSTACKDTVALANCFSNTLEIVDKYDRSETTPLHYACISENKEMLELLIKHEANVNAVQKVTKVTPLQLACQSGNEQIVKLLLVQGADPCIVDSYNNTALHYAARSSDNPEIIKAVLRHVDDKEKFVSMKNDGGITAIRLAVEENRLKVAEYLLKQHFGNHGKSEDEGKHDDCRQSDALLVHLAAQRRSPKMIKLLIEVG